MSAEAYEYDHTVNPDTPDKPILAEEFGALMSDYYNQFLYAAVRYANGTVMEPADIVHNAVVSVIARAKNRDLPEIVHQGPDSSVRYLSRSVSLAGIDMARREKRNTHTIVEELTFEHAKPGCRSHSPTVEEQVIGSDIVRTATDYLRTINEEFAHAFELIVLQGQDPRQYAANNNVNEATVRSRLRRARRILAGAYADGSLPDPR